MKTLPNLLPLLLLFLFSCSKEISQVKPNFNTVPKMGARALNATLPTDIPIVSVSASSSTAGLPPTNATDTSSTSFWSSAVHATQVNLEYIQYYFASAQNVNYVRLLPRYYNGAALCFPVDFQISYWNGSAWTYIAPTFPAYPSPSGLYVTLPFTTVNTIGIRISATKLGSDGTNYYLQFADVEAGYDAGFTHFQLTGNNGATLTNSISNVGSGTFNPSKMSNWTPEYRSPLISATPGGYSNIYAPSIVNNVTAWNVYFGGWDGTTDQHDRVSITVTGDNFNTFGPHVLQVDHGVFTHLNNESVIKIGTNNWRMYYTTYAAGGLNKPGYATSSDGASWTPNSGSTSYLLNMSGYANWSNADVNGSNVIYFDGSTYHLYFTDFNSTANGHTWNVHHATSSDGINFTYTGDPLNEFLIANDMKQFSYGGTNYYLLGLHLNSNFVKYSLSTNMTSFPSSQVLFNNVSSSDQYITSMGYVTNGNRLYGVLYGASPVNTLDHNAIFAQWLTKKVIFISDRTGARWGDIERAYGPDQIILFMSTNVETGHFYVYDTDGTTLLYTSPQVTMRAGDQWSYVP